MCRPDHMLNVCRPSQGVQSTLMGGTLELQWEVQGFHPSRVDLQTEDACGCVASLHLLSPHLLKILTSVQVPGHVHDRDRTEQKLKEPGQRKHPQQCGTPASASQEPATPTKRWASAAGSGVAVKNSFFVTKEEAWMSGEEMEVTAGKLYFKT